MHHPAHRLRILNLIVCLPLFGACTVTQTEIPQPSYDGSAPHRPEEQRLPPGASADSSADSPADSEEEPDGSTAEAAPPTDQPTPAPHRPEENRRPPEDAPPTEIAHRPEEHRLPPTPETAAARPAPVAEIEPTVIAHRPDERRLPPATPTTAVAVEEAPSTPTATDAPTATVTSSPTATVTNSATATATISPTSSPAHEHAPSDRATSHRSFADAEQWSKVFDDPERDKWQKPTEVVAALHLKNGHTVVDLGAGTGYFLAALSSSVGEDGVVYAVEVEPTLLAHMRARSEENDLGNVIPVLTSKDLPRLPPGRADVILIVDSFHHLDHRQDYLPLLQAALTPTGRVAIVDWRKEPLPVGPPPDHKIPRAAVITEMEAAGFTLVESLDFLPYQYFLIFNRPQARNSFWR